PREPVTVHGNVLENAPGWAGVRESTRPPLKERTGVAEPMDRNLRRRLLRPRHLLATGVVFLCLGGLVGGLFGVARAAQTPTASPFPFALAEPLSRDRGGYEVVA